MTSTYKEAFKSSFNLKKSGTHIMHTFFYSNISEFARNLELMLDEGTYKTTIYNMHKIGWKAQYFKSSDVSILVHGCDVSKCPQFYDKI